MKKGKHANQKNKNVLGKLERAVNRKANPHFNKKSQAENFDKDIIKEKENKGKLKSKIESQDAIEDFGNLAQLANKKYEVIPEQIALQTVNTINIVPINQSNGNNNNGAKEDKTGNLYFVNFELQVGWNIFNF